MGEYPELSEISVGFLGGFLTSSIPLGVSSDYIISQLKLREYS
jgi:hypothetical protein